MFAYFRKISDLCRKKVMEKKWITTEQMIDILKNDPERTRVQPLALWRIFDLNTLGRL